jgi:hypothetical protein
VPIQWFESAVELTVEVALSGATAEYGVWDGDLWDWFVWGPEAEWTDLSARMRPTLAVDRALWQNWVWSDGRAQAELRNDDAALSPANLSGPFVTAGITQIRPAREARILASYNGITYPLYRGYVEDFVEDWVGGVDAGAIVTVPMLDEWDRLGRFDGAETTPAGAGEASGARVHRILDNAGHGGTRNVDVGVITCLDTDLSKGATAELKLVSDSEGGAVYVDTVNEIVFADRQSLLDKPRAATVQALFGDGSGGPEELPCTDQKLTYGAALVRNMVSYQRDGGTPQVHVDDTSRALYQDRRDTRTDLICETDPQVDTLAQWTLARTKDPEYRFTSITIKPNSNPSLLFPVALGIRLRDLVTVRRRVVNDSILIERDCFVSGIHHEVRKDEWITTFDLVSASTYAAFRNSRWDTAEWDEVVWSF